MNNSLLLSNRQKRSSKSFCLVSSLCICMFFFCKDNYSLIIERFGAVHTAMLITNKSCLEFASIKPPFVKSPTTWAIELGKTKNHCLDFQETRIGLFCKCNRVENSFFASSIFTFLSQSSSIYPSHEAVCQKICIAWTV